jgi:hypothetical protein
MSEAHNRDILDWGQFPAYDLLYTDPPWGDRMVKWFNKKQLKDTGVESRHTLDQIMNHLAALADPRKPLVIEYEIKGWGYVVATMREHGHRFAKCVEAMQSMGRPFVILTFNTDMEIDASLKGFALVEDAVKKSGAKTVFDPFAGIGQTAKAVHRAGAEYIGSELNAARFAKLKAVIDAHENL